MKLTSFGVTDNSGNVIIPASGSQINVTTLVWSTEVTPSSGASGTLLSGTFTKIGGTETNLIVSARINGNGRSAGVCGSYIQIAGVNNYTYNYVYDNWSTGDQCYHGIDIWTGITAGTQTVNVGWATNDGAGGNLPFVYVNPTNGRTDSRHRAQSSYVVIWEVKA
jgi:hypothetical protein